MLKLAKWAYQLGVKQERVRIAAHLQSELRSQELMRDQQIGMLGSGEIKSKDRQIKLQQSAAIADGVAGVIRHMFEPRFEDSQLPSFMFPSDDVNKEIK